MFDLVGLEEYYDSCFLSVPVIPYIFVNFYLVCFDRGFAGVLDCSRADF
jgi:hypothetical protein